MSTPIDNKVLLAFIKVSAIHESPSPKNPLWKKSLLKSFFGFLIFRNYNLAFKYSRKVGAFSPWWRNWCSSADQFDSTHRQFPYEYHLIEDFRPKLMIHFYFERLTPFIFESTNCNFFYFFLTNSKSFFNLFWFWAVIRTQLNYVCFYFH